MSFVRNIAHDLVDKRLWPIAVALVAALAVIPVAFGGGGGAEPASPAPAPQGAAPGAAAAPSQALVVADETVLSKRTRKGAVRNPFRQQHVPKAKTAQGPSTATQTSATTTKAPAGGGSVSPGVKPTAPSALREPIQSGPSPKLRTYAVHARFGEPTQQRTLRDLARLTALPSHRRPLFVFLGVADAGRSAVFVVSGEAVSTGDGRCRPTPSRCDTVELRRGETQFFEIGAGTPSAMQYQLDITAIDRREADTIADARKAHRRVSKTGERLFEIAADAGVIDVDRWRFDASRGLLVGADG